MTLDLSLAGVEFRLGETLAGFYRHSDEFKPHVHPLRTPRGHCLTSARPHDHKHHKGLMYALRAEDVNFWEEAATSPKEVPGVERHQCFTDVVSRGSQVGVTETLRWTAEDGSLASFDETRKLSCRHDPAARAFIWNWFTRLVTLRPLHLLQSQWSHRLPNGTSVNYHGLGIRLRRDFGGLTRNHELRVDGVSFRENFQQQMGSRPHEVTFIGSIDETWPVERAGVTFQQQQNHALYVMEEPFPFMALGPTNLAPLNLEAGQTIEESFAVTVFDV
jgi:hypothetical protein